MNIPDEYVNKFPFQILKSESKKPHKNQKNPKRVRVTSLSPTNKPSYFNLNFNVDLKYAYLVLTSICQANCSHESN